MSLFGSLLGDVDDDAFFSNSRRHIQQMERVMAFPNLLGPNFNPMAIRPRDINCNRQLIPFPNLDIGGFPDMFGGFGNMFSNMEMMGSDPSVHSFSSSSVMTMTTTPDGTPQVYQASSSTRRAPGGIRETCKTETDSRTGVKKMAVGRHIGERGHVMERKKNHHTGDEEENTEYINLDEEEGASFNEEWRHRCEQGTGAVPNHRHHHYHSQSRIPAIGGSRHRHRHYEATPLPALTAGSSQSASCYHDRRKRENQRESGSAKGRKMGRYSRPHQS